MIIDNKKIFDYLSQKEELITEGRKISKQIEDVERHIAEIDRKERKITSKVEPKELIDRGNEIKEQVNKLIKELDKIGVQIQDTKLAAIPEDVKKKHYALRAEKEAFERERNKIALKVQKVKDKVVPLIKKEVKPLLNEYEDIETAEIKGGKVTIKVFSHLDEFKKRFKK